MGKATQPVLGKEQYEMLPGLSVGEGGYQTVFARAKDSVKRVNVNPVATVCTNELQRLRERAQRPDEGSWQDRARSVLIANQQFDAREKN